MVDNLYDLSRADLKLALGMKVSVCWMENGFVYRGEGEITRLERFNVTVRLFYAQGGMREHGAGRLVQLPRFTDQTRWSKRNCAMPA